MFGDMENRKPFPILKELNNNQIKYRNGLLGCMDNVAGLGAISRSCLGQIVSGASTLIPLNVSVVEAQTLELGSEIVESQGWQ